METDIKGQKRTETGSRQKRTEIDKNGRKLMQLDTNGQVG